MVLKKKLIEVALPLEAINRAARDEKAVPRPGHPQTMHYWWARRPLAAARAVIFAQMVDDPSAHPDIFRNEKAQEKERQRLFRIIEDLVKWENTTNETVLQRARDEIWQSWRYTCAENADHPRAKELFDRYKLPAFHDPFAGGGSLPLEAQRLGLEAYASDLNPVALLINKAMIEIPPKFAGKPPVSLGARASRPHKHWHSRGYLPHCDTPELIQAITFRLFDALPAETCQRLQNEASDKPDMRKKIEAWMDAGKGACWLKVPDIGALVEDTLIFFDGQRYRLLAWCIMPNHVHALIETRTGHPLHDVVQSWKSYTAKEINRILGRTGKVWHPEYFDRFIRDEVHFQAVIRYIHENPVKAGLVKCAEDWPFSSTRLLNEKAGETPALPGMGREWKGAQGLAEDVRYYGKWMRDEAQKRIGHLYPKIEVTAEMVKERPDLKPYAGRRLTVIAWLWARTVKSPNPAFAQVDVPLASTFMLSTKPGKEAYVEPILGTRASGPHKTADETSALPGYRFTVKMGKPKNPEAAKNGTKLSRGANFRCVMSGAVINDPYIKAESMAGRMGARLMAIVAEGERGRVYLPPTPEHEEIARQAKPTWKPDMPMNRDTANLVSGRGYGFFTWADLFTPRQLVALTTFSDLVQEARERVKRDALGARASRPQKAARMAALPGDDVPLDAGGTGATAYADAVAVYLGLAVSRTTNTINALAVWSQSREQSVNLFSRQAIPMAWDFPEVNPFAGAAGDFGATTASVAKTISGASDRMAWISQADAQTQNISKAKIVSTDPPYYDNVSYADLSDFFYVWLRSSLQPMFPDLFATLAVPKVEELVAMAYRYGSKQKAEAFFLDGMTQAMNRLAEQAHPVFPVTIYYAFKQSENDDINGAASTGWETFLEAVIRAGFAITGTLPMRTERPTGVKTGTNALASSIILVCRPRAADSPITTRREFVVALKKELPKALVLLQRGNIAPVDLAQAAIGPGMAVFTHYNRILDAEGNPLTVREALSLINQTLDETLAEQEGDFDADTRWALSWFEQHGFSEGEFGVADILSKAKNTSVEGMVKTGILYSGRGKVRLLQPKELPENWDPADDKRFTVWEAVHQLIRSLETGGEKASAELAARLGSKAEIARDLAYRLYTICERKKRPREALSYNALVQSFTEIGRLAQEHRPTAPTEGTLPGFG